MRWKQITAQPLAHFAIAIAITAALAGSFYATPATAGKPSWAGNNAEEHGKSHKKHKAHKKGKAKSKTSKHGKHFHDKDADVMRHYYQNDSRNGKACPPGLAKKNNGCMPPGQTTKQWTSGEPLPHNLRRYDLPRDLVSRLPIPPQGQRYVRILTDILLVDSNTDVVIDAIVDILIP